MAIRTGLYVARLGTVSAASKALKIHRATVIRHIDELEQELGEKLFHRHARGYHTTDAGKDLLQVANATEEQFRELAGRTRGKTQRVQGPFIVTSTEVMEDYLLPILKSFRDSYPDIQVELESTPRVANLEYGEAHVAIRAGRKPSHPDNVVLPLFDMETGLFAHRSYIEKHGHLKHVDEIEKHTFIGDMDKATDVPFRVWMRKHVPSDQIVFRSNKNAVQRQAVRNGLAIGFLPKDQAAEDPDLIETLPSMRSWRTRFWVTTHVDVHRSQKVQAFLRVLRHAFAERGLLKTPPQRTAGLKAHRIDRVGSGLNFKRI
ncbi:MAG: LysR family transcriptional regulator [Pseudomonadota bacterium]